jgi:hypothetical protein
VLNLPFFGAAAAAQHRLGALTGRLLLDWLTAEYSQVCCAPKRVLPQRLRC